MRHDLDDACGTPAISLVGTPGDFHNRCGVSVCTEWAPDGSCITESWQAIRPAHICRQYSDPLKYPAGSCPDALIFNQQPYIVKAKNIEAAGTVLEQKTVAQLRCLGPNTITGSFGPQAVRFANFEGLPVFNEYVPVNYTIWEPVTDFNFDNLQLASMVMFSFFFKNSWVQFMELTVEATHGAVTFVFMGIIISISYYLLNLTVGIMCLNFSESIREEKLAGGGGGEEEEEEEEEEEDPDGDDDSEDGDLEQGMRKELLDALDTDDAPCMGNACFPLHLIVPLVCKVLELSATVIITKVLIIKLLDRVEP